VPGPDRSDAPQAFPPPADGSSSIENDLQFCENLIDRAYTLRLAQSFDAAETVYRQAKLFAAENGLIDQEARATQGVGSAQWELGKVSEALFAFESAAALGQRAGNIHVQYRSNSMIGSALTVLRNDAGALQAFDRAILLCDRHQNPVEYCCIVNNKAIFLIERVRSTAEPEQRSRHLRRAGDFISAELLDLVERAPDQFRWQCLDTIAQYRVFAGLADTAYELFIHNLRRALDLDEPHGIGLSRIGAGEALVAMGRFDEAVAMLRQAINGPADPRLAPDVGGRAHIALATAYEALGQFDRALEAQRNYTAALLTLNETTSRLLTRHMVLMQELEHSKAEADAYRRFSEELTAARDTAQAASRAKSDFLSDISHELRTPLNAIIGFAELIQAEIYGPIPERYLGYLGDIHGSGRHLLELINQLLDLSKAEAGKLDLHESDCDLQALALEALGLIRPLADAGGIDLRGPAAAGIVVRGDALRLKQCLINLLSNAVKFTPVGGIVSLDFARPQSGFAIAVTDTGTGIDPDQLGRLFERFSEGGNGAKVIGTGLGLPLTKRLVELHGGSIGVESAPGQGTTVTINLPNARLVG